MTPRFLAFIPLLLREETEFNSNGSVRTEHDPNDPGGTTKFGIDQRAHPHIDIGALTKADARGIYFGDWERTNVEGLPARIGELLFDIRENGGPGAQWLQSALGFQKPDGWIGPVTLAAAAALDSWGIRRAVISICDARVARYRQLAADRPRLARFLKGWLNRDRDVRAFCLEPMTA